MTKQVNKIAPGKYKIIDQEVQAKKDKTKDKKPKDMTSKEAIDYLFAYLGIDIEVPLP